MTNTTSNSYESWGRFPKTQQTIVPLHWRSEDLHFLGYPHPLLPFGQGRSYGDSCLNDGGILLTTSGLNRFIAFDENTGILRCESGVTLATILEYFVPKGWFLPVTPGTKFVSVGGAIANDIHGKNHHRDGTFGRHVLRFELLRSDKEHFLCSPVENTDLFRATIGGLGLTGLITWAEIQLKPIQSAFIEMESIRFDCLDDFFKISSQSDRDFEYTVAWIDCLAKGDSLGRGIFMRGNHEKTETSHDLKAASPSRITIPCEAPNFLLNNLSIRLFNQFYYCHQQETVVKKRIHFDPFFYPLDSVGHWNRLYGKRGLLQYQCVVPDSPDHEPTRKLLRLIAESGNASFLTVLKTFGDLPSPGMLSFPKKGVTLALDFPMTGKKILNFLERLDHIVREYGGSVYPAKDARMSAQSFQSFYPNWKEFAKYLDPKFSSSFWRRVT